MRYDTDPRVWGAVQQFAPCLAVNVKARLYPWDKGAQMCGLVLVVALVHMLRAFMVAAQQIDLLETKPKSCLQAKLVNH